MPESEDPAWPVVAAASALTERLQHVQTRRSFRFADRTRTLVETDATNTAAELEWDPAVGWVSKLPLEDPRGPMVDLYLPLCSATDLRPIVVGHLGQSLDGFIATSAGDSHFVTGEHNILHLHRMRALCDAVIVGPGTVAADDPQLTTRLVEGPNPIRVVVDLSRRLEPTFKVFTDGVAPTLYVCARDRIQPDVRMGTAEVLTVTSTELRDALPELVEQLRRRGHRRLFVEGGGVTVSACLEAGVLDRVQIAIAPLLIGEGRPALRLEPRPSLSECRRPSCRVFRMGSDVLFDCDLRSMPVNGSDGSPRVTRMS